MGSTEQGTRRHLGSGENGQESFPEGMTSEMRGGGTTASLHLGKLLPRASVSGSVKGSSHTCFRGKGRRLK